jgi:hypothetical protein
MKLKTIILSSVMFLSFSFANAQDNSNLFRPTPNSENEVLKIITSPENLNNTELVMSVLKSIEDLGIKDTNRKIDFVSSLKVSDDIKAQVIGQVRNSLSYSDHEKVSYGMYKVKSDKCHFNNSNAKGLRDYIPLRGYCFYQQYYEW